MLCAAVLAARDAEAAGGHHAVDDAALLDPGQCQLETWFDRHPVGEGSLIHAGPGCRAGPVEIGLDLDRYRGDSSTRTYTSAQLKYARPLSAAWSVGIAAQTSMSSRASHYSGSSIVLPVTWTMTDALWMHLNLGRDFVPARPDTPHNGVALEWAASSRWSFVAERFQEIGDGFWRVGARYAISPMLNVDLSSAHDTRVDAARRWTAGLTWVIDR